MSKEDYIIPKKNILPKKEWQELTDDEISALFVDDPIYMSGRKLARAIEQALRNKNAL